jgi:hypothetical protein
MVEKYVLIINHIINKYALLTPTGELPVPPLGGSGFFFALTLTCPRRDSKTKTIRIVK